MVAAAVANDDNVTRLGFAHRNGITERTPGFRKSVGFGRLPAGLAGDGMQEETTPRGAAGIGPRMFFRLLLFLDSCSPVYFSAWFSMPAEAGATTVKAKAADRINADTLKRLALMLEGARVL